MLEKNYCRTFAVYRTMTSCFKRTEHWLTVHATLRGLRSCVLKLLNRKTGLQMALRFQRLNPIDYSLWGALVYRHKILDIDRLKHVLIDVKLTEPSARSAAKKDVHVEFRLRAYMIVAATFVFLKFSIILLAVDIYAN